MSAIQDLRFALRTLRRRRTFALIAIGTLALGIGAATSIYSIVDGVLLRPLPFEQPGRLVQVRQIFYKWKGDPVLDYMWDRIPFGVDEFEQLRDNNTVFESVGLWNNPSMLATVGAGGTPERVHITQASATLLHVLGERVVRGRGINPGEDLFGGPKVAIVGYEEWQQRFGGAEDVIGKTVTLDDVAYQVVGVLPKGIKLGLGDEVAAFWIPVGQEAGDRGRGNRSYSVVARLKPGVTIERAELEANHILADSTVYGPKGARVADWQTEQTRAVRAPIYVLFGAVALLMLIACANVATLLLGEAASRGQEMAARVALGAGRGRIIRQLLTESAALAGCGAAAGALLAWWGTKALIAAAPPRIPGIEAVRVDLRVLGFAVAVAAVTGIVFGLAPALALSRLPAASLIRSGAGHSVAGRGRLQRTFIAVQLALSVILLLGAGLFSRSLMRLSNVDPGFRTDHLAMVRLSVPRSFYRDSLGTRAFFHRAVERIAAVPGVAQVTVASSLPFDGNSSSSSVAVEGRPLPAGQLGPESQQRSVYTNYFDVMGIPLVAGRGFTDADRAGAERVMVVSEAMARRDFPGEKAVGGRVRFQGQVWTIVGVVRDVKLRGLDHVDEATVYTPFDQRNSFGSFGIRTTVPPASIAGALRALVPEIDHDASVGEVGVMDDQVRASFADQRFRTILVTTFGVLAALLAAVGMYGVSARAVAQRTREVGIRVALGATPASVVRLVIRSALGGVAIGVAVGLASGFAGAHWAQGLLFEIDARDPVTYVLSVAFIAVVAVVATWLPARRAEAVHPAAVLRGE